MRSTILTSKRARGLRSTMTEPEVMLWSKLKAPQDPRLKFRRQHPLGPYILDFYCAAAKLAVEIDGAVHTDDRQMAHDLRRDDWLRSQGLHVLRIPAAAVFADLTGVADAVCLRAHERIQGSA